MNPILGRITGVMFRLPLQDVGADCVYKDMHVVALT